MNKYLTFLIILLLLPFTVYAYDNCTESGSGWLVCEDWDYTSPAPPNSNWPCKDCASWRGWTPNDTIMSTINAISSTSPHSGSYSLKCQNETIGSEHPGCDIHQTTATHPNPAYIRFYLKVAVGSGTQTHLIFMNQFNPADAAIDFRGCADSDYNDCDNFYLAPHTYSPEYWIAYNNGHDPFDWLDHLNEWHLVEIKADFSEDTCSIWVDETYVLENASINWNVTESYLTMFRISNWNNNGNSTIYIDDFVVSSSYVGPRGGDTTAPTVTAFVIPSTSSSLTVPISTFTATDAVGVTGYCVNESATPPTSGSCSGSGWEGSAQTSYTFSTEGAKTLYPWAKDAAGNISDSAGQYDQVIVSIPTASGIIINNGSIHW